MKKEKRNLEILKLVLKEQDEDPTEKVETFEDNPMEFILRKYKTLDEVMTELMTSSYKEYLDAVFIVAPKPTTFKIVLHNGQFFYLTYLGKVYEATVAGKKYYLSNIGEKERCMLAISRILRGGNPLKSKGPEGAEQGTREGEESSGGGGGFEGGSETGGAEATGGEEAGEETEETLEEMRLVEAIMKKSIPRTSNKEKVSLLNVAKEQLDSLGYKGKKDSKHGAHLRYQIGTEKEVLETLNSALQKITGGKQYYKIEVIQPDDFSKGAKSGKYTTYKATIVKPVGEYKKGEEVFFVNQQTEKATVTKKSLTPTNLGITGKKFRTHSELNNALKSSVSRLKDKKLSELLVNLTDLVDKKVKSRFSSISDLEGYEESIPFDEKTLNLMQQFSQQDINSIGVDYGEELGALALLKSVKNPQVGVEFPVGNNPLADFTLDGYNISSKYDKGASATLTAIVNGLNPAQLTTKDQKNLYGILKAVVLNKVPQGYIEVAKSIKSPGIDVLSSIIKIDADEITAQDINDYVVRLLSKAKTSQEKSALVMKKFAPFYKEIKRQPQNGVINFEKMDPSKYYGVVLGPLSYYVADKMNENPKFTKTLTELLSKIEVKQLYLVFSVNKKLLNLKLKSFTDKNAKFKFDIGSQSVYNPSNSRLAFKLL